MSRLGRITSGNITVSLQIRRTLIWKMKFVFSVNSTAKISRGCWIGTRKYEQVEVQFESKVDKRPNQSIDWWGDKRAEEEKGGVGKKQGWDGVRVEASHFGPIRANHYAIFAWKWPFSYWSVGVQLVDSVLVKDACKVRIGLPLYFSNVTENTSLPESLTTRPILHRQVPICHRNAKRTKT